MKTKPSFTLAVLVLSSVAGLMMLGTREVSAAAAILVVDDDLACPSAAYPTISLAVLAASPGDTIQVCAGTYAENVIINKSLTLLGAQAGVDARGRVASESIIAPVSGTGITLITGSVNSTIDGFTFQGGSRGLESTSGPINNLQILNNRFVSFTGSGIFLNDPGTDITVDKNVVDGSSKVGSGNSVHLDTDGFAGFWLTNNNIVNGLATGFFVDGNHNVGESATRAPLIKGNLVSGLVTGMNLGTRAFGTFGPPLLGTYGGRIETNTFMNNSFDGLQGGMQHVLITLNTFKSNGRHGIALTSFGNTGADRGAQNSSVTCNLIISNGFVNAGSGVLLSATQAAGTIGTNVVNNNNIHLNAVGLTYAGTEVVNATNNWWGSATGPTIASNPSGTGDSIVNPSGGVSYFPFLTAQSPCAPAEPIPTGTITVHKFVDSGGASLTSFCFTLSPDPGNGQVCADGSGNAVFNNVPAGTYSANETASPATYHPVSNTCTGLNIAAQGDSRSCDVHDTINTGTVTVHKTIDSGPASPTVFCFTLSPDPGNGQVCANGSGDAIFSNVPAGTYGATETASPAFYHQVSTTCSGLTITAQGDSRTCDVHDAINTGPVACASFRDVRRAPDINCGPDLGGTGHQAINFTGSAGAGGDTWITVDDVTPGNPDQGPIFGSVKLSADVLIHTFNNKKGAGLLALYNEGGTKKGLALIVYDSGGTDTLVLATVNQAGQLAILKTVALGPGIAENAWYRVTVDLIVSGGTASVTAEVHKHNTANNADSPVGALVGAPLTYSNSLAALGLDPTGEVGVIASSISAVVDSSVANFAIVP